MAKYISRSWACNVCGNACSPEAESRMFYLDDRLIGAVCPVCRKTATHIVTAIVPCGKVVFPSPSQRVYGDEMDIVEWYWLSEAEAAEVVKSLAWYEKNSGVRQVAVQSVKEE